MVQPLIGQSRKTLLPIEIIVLLIHLIQSNDEHPEKALLPKLTNENGRSIVFKDAHP